MAADPMMACRCCGKWVVAARSYVGRPPILRVTYDGIKVQDCYSVEQVESILNRNGIDIAALEAVT